MLAIHQSVWSGIRVFSRQQSFWGWLGLVLSGSMFTYRIMAGHLFLVPVYGFVVLAWLIFQRFWRQTPAPVRLIAAVAVLTIFCWATLTANDPAHALLFNRLLDQLREATSAWGIPLPDIPNWMAQGLRIVALVIVVPVFIRLLRSRDGEEDETGRAFAKVVKVLVILGLGDAVLSLFDI